MIKFFRNIRRKLIQEYRLKKYLLYALGEILLVVLGILIALQINNLNEARKAKQFEHEMLRDIQHSIHNNYRQLSRSIGCNEGTANAGELILNYMDNDLPYHDSLDIYFSRAVSFCTPTVRNAGYESLLSSGLHIITNDSIRRALDIYNIDWLQNLGNRQEDYFYNTATPILTGLFETVAMRTEMKPFDYQALKSSKEYRSILNSSIANRKDQVVWYKDWRENLQRLERMIDRELE